MVVNIIDCVHVVEVRMMEVLAENFLSIEVGTYARHFEEGSYLLTAITSVGLNCITLNRFYQSVISFFSHS